MKNKAVFLDRDGVINEIVHHKEMGILDSPANVDEFNLFPDAADAINKLHQLGFKVIIISNQPGIAKDKLTIETFEKIRKKMKDELAQQGADIDAEYYCFHHPEGKNMAYTKICDCRKPKPGLILNAAAENDIDLKNSWMIGDGITDIHAGIRAGCRTILIGRMKCDICNLMEDIGVKPDFIAQNLNKATIIIEQEM
jgi:D-glycero-D-manno-heptose 1,7-bisphosphate phosphatase